MVRALDKADAMPTLSGAL